ncbi:START-like domain superfamily [Sesbania bispinosa]|nr:START-like domain superfamily [Sesbania bispinosa]
MEKKRKIVQYRERLDRTLASPDLTNDETLKKLVKSQLLPSSEPEIEGYKEQVVETKTAEVSNFLSMLRSASDDCGTSHTDWKLKQDGEEFRVMYREGPEGTPFHTLLVEGFVDGPVDVCLCISWQTSLYKKWWPQSTIPSFKILSSECLHEARIGEQISLVRVKVSWPLHMREAVVHYYLFEYFQDDLIVVLTNSVPDSKNMALHGFNNEAIPEAKDVVRVDLVGGFALQKVTSGRSYFRIGITVVSVNALNGNVAAFIVLSKMTLLVVASMMSHDKEEFSKALGDPLYARIREALYSTSESKVMNGELQQVARILPAEDLVESMQGEAKDVSKEDESNQNANKAMSMAMNAVVLQNSKVFGEIVEVDREEIVQSEEDDEKVNEIPNKEVDASVQKGKRSVYIRSEVEQALETLDKAISMVRENRLHSRIAFSNSANEESPCMIKDGRIDSHSSNLIQPCSENEVGVELPNRDLLEGTLQDALGTNSGIQNFR